MTLDYKKMVTEIDKLLEGDWAFDLIDGKNLPNAKPFTQKEAKKLSDIMGKIYNISHCIHCKACQTKYII